MPENIFYSLIKTCYISYSTLGFEDKCIEVLHTNINTTHVWTTILKHLSLFLICGGKYNVGRGTSPSMNK